MSPFNETGEDATSTDGSNGDGADYSQTEDRGDDRIAEAVVEVQAVPPNLQKT